jgi:hypothetical protein
MNIETHFLVDTVIGEVQQALRNGDQPAVAVLEGLPTREHSFADYLRDPAKAAEYERRLAREAATVELERLILAVPMVATPLPVVDEDSVRFRSPYTGPLRDDHDEYDVIVYTVYDTEEGVSSGMAPYTRNPDGTYSFGAEGDPNHIVTIPVNPARTFPGMTLLREILDENLQLRRTPKQGDDGEPG